MRSEPASSVSSVVRLASGAPGWVAASRSSTGVERLEFDLDSLGAVLGGGLALGDDERDRLPGVHDLGLGERLVHAAGTGGLDRQVVGGQDRDHARGGLRRVGADRGDQRVRLVGEDEPGVQQAGDREVGGEPRLPTHLRLGVAPGCRDADCGHISNVAASRRGAPRTLSRVRT